jgi:hypothetical protein
MHRIMRAAAPSVVANVSGRYRTEFSLTLSREIVRGFTAGVTAYDSYDSKPPAGSSSTHDFGISLNIGWTV